MGPITLIDKSTLQGLSFEEVSYLDRYYSLVVSPILMRELLSTLAKEPEPNKDWEKTLSILAAKADTMSSFTPPSAHEIARASLLGDQTPMTGQVPMSGGTRVRSRDGTYGVIFGESEQKKILRDWKQKKFNDYYRKEASQIRKVDHEVDLQALKKSIAGQLSNFPKFETLAELAAWMDEVYFRGASPEFHLKSMAGTLISQEELKDVILRWKRDRKPISEFAPYSFYFYRVNILYQVGLGKELIPSSKSAKTHLDVQYLYYLPFSMCFTSSDKPLMEMAAVFKRENQILIPGAQLKADLKSICNHFEAMPEDAKLEYYGDSGGYPPDISGSVTVETWGALMRPRSELSAPRPRRSKEEEKALVERLHKQLHDAVTVEGSCVREGVKPRPKRSIVERNLLFVDGVLEKIGLSEEKSWEQIKKGFASAEVKAIFDLHADLWHPSDPFQELADEFCGDGKLRALYLGDIEPFDLVEQVWRWSLHFDQILIPDPFDTPWSRKEEYNQIANPEQFESDTLKLVYALTALHPLLLSGQVLLVPDPADYDPALKKRMLDTAQNRIGNSIYKEITADEEERLKIIQFHMEMRFMARLPLEKQKREATVRFNGMAESDVLAYFSRIRQYDELCIDRESSVGQMSLSRSGANFDSSLLLASLYRAIPISPLTSRAREYGLQSTLTPELLRPLADRLLKIPSCKILDPNFAVLVKEKGALEGFRGYLRECLIAGKNSDQNIEALFADLEEEARFLAEFYAHQTGVEGSVLFETQKIEFIWSDNRFLTSDAISYIDSFNPNLKKYAPLCFLGFPTTKMPRMPFGMQ